MSGLADIVWITLQENFVKSQKACEFTGYKRKKINKEVTPIEQRNDQGSKCRKAGYRSNERKRTEHILCNAFKSNIFSFQTAASGSTRSKEVAMTYRSAKVYNDGSHYIAIPQTNNSTKQKKRPTKTVCTGTELQTVKNKTDKTATEILTPKERFERIYKENDGKGKAEKIEILTKELKQDFKTEEQTREFIERNIERLQRNKIVRKTRLARKINLNEWNWFCTFTYSNKKHTEESFRKRLSEVLKRMVHRKGWKYIGVWERGGETNRLHFHGICYIPENGMPGELEVKKDYRFGSRKRQMIMQNTYFNDKFGRNDFNELSVRREITDSARYLMKYIEKSGEKLIYSRNIPTYFRSDIMDEDVLCTIGQEDKKLLLSDDFKCWDEGCYVGKVSPGVIKQMPKCN